MKITWFIGRLLCGCIWHCTHAIEHTLSSSRSFPRLPVVTFLSLAQHANPFSLSLFSCILSLIQQYILISPHINQRYYRDNQWVVFSQLALTTRQKPVCIIPPVKRPLVESSFQAMMRLRASWSVIVWWRRMKSRCYFWELESLERLVVSLYLRWKKKKRSWRSLFSQLCSSKWSLFTMEATTSRNVNPIEKLSIQTPSNLCGRLSNPSP